MASTDNNTNVNDTVRGGETRDTENGPAPAKRRRVGDDGDVPKAAENEGTTNNNASTAAATPLQAPTAPVDPPPPSMALKFQVDSGLTNQNKKDGIPPWRKVQEMLLTEENVAQVLIEKEIITVPTLCPKCHQSIKIPKKGVRLRCKKCYSRNGGEWSQSLLKGTFFEFGRLKVHDMLMFLYHWLCGAKHKQLCLLMGWSNSTMFRWVSYAQELVAAVTFYENMDATITTDNTPITKIGGQDVVVQIDDCSFDKRNCRHPHYVKGGWIFAGVEVTPKRRYFSCVVDDQSPDKWMDLVRKHVAAGSIVKSHNWSSHNILEIQPSSQFRLSTKQNTNNCNMANNNNQNLGPLHHANPLFDTHFVNPFQPPHNNNIPMTNLMNNNPPPPDLHTLHANAFVNPVANPIPIPNMPLATTTNSNNHDEEEETWLVPEEPLQATNASPSAAPAPPTRKHNNVKELQGSLFEFIWRKQHEANLWNALLWTIKEVKYELQ